MGAEDGDGSLCALAPPWRTIFILCLWEGNYVQRWYFKLIQYICFDMICPANQRMALVNGLHMGTHPRMQQSSPSDK
jgi:hypothetical protein